jgi:heptosyltransferase-3
VDLNLKRRLFARVRPDFSRIRKILIVRQDRIGDVVLTLPLATVIKQQFPNIKVSFLVREYTSSLCRNHPDVDETFTIPENATAEDWNEIGQKIKTAEFDMAIVPNSKKQIAALVFKAGIPVRMSAGIRLHSWKYNHLLMQSRKKPVKNELDYNLDLLRKYLAVPPKKEIDFKLSFSPGAAKGVNDFLAANRVQNYCIIHPGSGGSAIDLPMYTLAALIREHEFGMPVIITGSETEKSLYNFLKVESGKDLIDATGRFNLDELTALIAGCSLFLSNSTGPVHIANAFRKKLLGFYSTYKACHPVRWGPYNREQAATIIPPAERYESMEPSKEKSRQHMKLITPALIEKKLKEL